MARGAGRGSVSNLSIRRFTRVIESCFAFQLGLKIVSTLVNRGLFYDNGFAPAPLI